MRDFTIRDVAKIAGVSIATVSRVINNFDNVRPETVKKVHDAMESINFFPNASARNLKNDRSKFIGLLITNISNSHFTNMAKIIDTIVRKEGYSLIICSSADNPETEKEYLQRLMQLRIDGLILNTTNKNDDYVSEISQTVPVVLVDRNIESPSFKGDFIGSNNYEGVRSMTRHLIKCGHRKIGIITSHLDVSTGRERIAGFKAAMREIGIDLDENYPYRYDSKFFSVEGGVDGCKYLMKLNDPPTAIVVFNNTMAVGVYKCLHSMSKLIPEDVSVISYGNIENCDLFCVEPSFVTLNPYFIGEKAARNLLSRIKSPEVGNREVIYEPQLILNGSCNSI